MQEILTNAWLGWQRYTDGGKYAALLILVLLFLWFCRKEEKQRALLIYTTLVTLFCIFPVSAAFLMMYQTKFYDYEWIWNYVPVTLMIAYGCTVFLTEYWENCKKNIWKCVGVTVAVLTLVFLCGGMGQDAYGMESGKQKRLEAKEVLGQLIEEGGNDICLWAPKEIMENARAYDGNIRLVYGRNMWDAALGAYTYEVYDKNHEFLYLWMCNVEEKGVTEYVAEKGSDSAETDNAQVIIDSIWCLEAAKSLGVNRVLLPGNILPEELQKLTEAWGTEPVQLGEYYLFVLQ